MPTRQNHDHDTLGRSSIRTREIVHRLDMQLFKHCPSLWAPATHAGDRQRQPIQRVIREDRSNARNIVRMIGRERAGRVPRSGAPRAAT